MYGAPRGTAGNRTPYTPCQTGHFYICAAAPFAAARARARETRRDRLLALLVISVKRT